MVLDSAPSQASLSYPSGPSAVRAWLLAGSAPPGIRSSRSGSCLAGRAGRPRPRARPPGGSRLPLHRRRAVRRVGTPAAASTRSRAAASHRRAPSGSSSAGTTSSGASASSARVRASQAPVDQLPGLRDRLGLGGPPDICRSRARDLVAPVAGGGDAEGGGSSHGVGRRVAKVGRMGNRQRLLDFHGARSAVRLSAWPRFGVSDSIRQRSDAEGERIRPDPCASAGTVSTGCGDAHPGADLPQPRQRAGKKEAVSGEVDGPGEPRQRQDVVATGHISRIEPG